MRNVRGREAMKNPRLNPMVLLVAAMGVTGFGSGLDAATITAASCDHADVQNAIARAADGDTVLVPAGSAAWTKGIALSKTVILKGAGIGRTRITNDYVEGSLVTIRESTTGNIRIQGFDFIPGTGPGPHPTFFIEVNYAADGKPVLITANTFTLGTG